MAKDFRTAWAEIKAQRDQETRTSLSSSPAKTSAPPRRKMAGIDHLINQLVDPQLESELADAAWYAARKSIYERDPRNFSYNTRLNSWGK
jgi:hypothetical protein